MKKSHDTSRRPQASSSTKRKNKEPTLQQIKIYDLFWDSQSGIYPNHNQVGDKLYKALINGDLDSVHSINQPLIKRWQACDYDEVIDDRNTKALIVANAWTLGLASCRRQGAHIDVLLKSLPFDLAQRFLLHEKCYIFTNAARHGDLDLVNYLLQYPIVQEHLCANDNQAFRHACDNGHLEMIEILLTYEQVRRRVTACVNEGFRHAALFGHLDVFNRLLKIPEVVKQVAAKGNYALVFACQNGHERIVDRLLEYKQVRDNIAADDNAAFRACVRFTPIAMKLMSFKEVKENLHVADNYALALACQCGNITLVNRMLTFQAVKEQVACGENRALVWAAGEGHLNIVKLLLTFQDVRNKVSDNENRALDWAACRGHIQVVKLLLEHIQSNFLYPVIQSALDENRVEVAALLYKYSQDKDPMFISNKAKKERFDRLVKK